MTPVIAALAATFLLVGTASAQAQVPGGAAGNSEPVATQASPVPGQPDVRPAGRPKLRDQLLQGAINVLLNPRPRPAPPQTEPAPLEPEPAAIEPVIEVPAVVAVEPTPPAPRPAAIVPKTPTVATVAVPRPTVAPTKPTPAIPPAPNAASPTPIEPTPPPPPVTETVDPAPQAAEPVAAEPSPVVVETVDPIPAPVTEPDRPSESSNWLLLGLLVAAATVAVAVQWRRVRQIARTRAALSLNPSLDLTAGAGSLNGLALAAPPLAIRARLDLGEAQRG